MKKHTLGFIFDKDLKRVVLMEKQTPAWQKGRFNGIGGKHEGGESSHACMVREAREECGLETAEHDWVYVGAMQGETWSVDIMAHVHEGSPDDVRTIEDEKVSWFKIDDLPERAHSNIPWLVALAKDKIAGRGFAEFTAVYKDTKDSA